MRNRGLERPPRALTLLGRFWLLLTFLLIAACQSAQDFIHYVERNGLPFRTISALKRAPVQPALVGDWVVEGQWLQIDAGAESYTVTLLADSLNQDDLRLVGVPVSVAGREALAIRSPDEAKGKWYLLFVEVSGATIDGQLLMRTLSQADPIGWLQAHPGAELWTDHAPIYRSFTFARSSAVLRDKQHARLAAQVYTLDQIDLFEQRFPRHPDTPRQMEHAARRMVDGTRSLERLSAIARRVPGAREAALQRGREQVSSAAELLRFVEAFGLDEREPLVSEMLARAWEEDEVAVLLEHFSHHESARILRRVQQDRALAACRTAQDVAAVRKEWGDDPALEARSAALTAVLELPWGDIAFLPMSVQLTVEGREAVRTIADALSSDGRVEELILAVGVTEVGLEPDEALLLSMDRAYQLEHHLGARGPLVLLPRGGAPQAVVAHTLRPALDGAAKVYRDGLRKYPSIQVHQDAEGYHGRGYVSTKVLPVASWRHIAAALRVGADPSIPEELWFGDLDGFEVKRRWYRRGVRRLARNLDGTPLRLRRYVQSPPDPISGL